MANAHLHQSGIRSVCFANDSQDEFITDPGQFTQGAGQFSRKPVLIQIAQAAGTKPDSNLFPDAENPQLPDADTILAAQNTLSTTLDAMPGTLSSIASATQTTLYNLNRDLNAISGQISAMGQTLNNASENLGGTITDISDFDTPELLTAKVETCANYGKVLSDLNAGGICGWQSLGLVKESGNTGKIDAENANYVGGISGLATGYLRSNYAKCEISGKTYVGGIAGSGTIVTDSLSQVMLIHAKEKLGAILGYAEEPKTDEENPVSGNIYLNSGTDYGAINGISYSGSAEPMDFDTFMDMGNLPEIFKKVTIRFQFEDGTQKQIELPSGSSLAASRIPAIPEKTGYTAHWEGLEDADLTNVLFDMVFEVHYTTHHTTIQSEESRNNGLPIMLVEGVFTDSAGVSIAEAQDSPVLAQNETLLEVWDISLSEAGTTGRFLLPDDVDSGSVKLLVLNDNGSWSEIPFVQDGSYLVFELSQAETTFSLVQTAQSNAAVYIAAAFIALIAVAILYGCRRKHTHTAKEATKHEAD